MRARDEERPEWEQNAAGSGNRGRNGPVERGAPGTRSWNGTGMSFPVCVGTVNGPFENFFQKMWLLFGLFRPFVAVEACTRLKAHCPWPLSLIVTTLMSITHESYDICHRVIRLKP